MVVCDILCTIVGKPSHDENTSDIIQYKQDGRGHQMQAANVQLLAQLCHPGDFLSAKIRTSHSGLAQGGFRQEDIFRLRNAEDFCQEVLVVLFG